MRYLLAVFALSAFAQQPVLIRQGGNTATVTGSSALKVDGSAVTQPVSGTVTVTDGAGALNVIVDSGTVTTVSTVTSLTQMNGQAIAMGTGTRSAGTQRVTIATDDVVPASQSGTWTVQPGNTANTTPWLVTSRVVGNAGASVDSTIGAGTAPTNQIVTGAVYNSTEISPTAGQAFAIQADSKGRTRQVLMDAAGNTRGLNIDTANAALVNPGTAANWGVGATGAAPPVNAQFVGGISSGATGGLQAGITVCDQWVAINGTASAQLIAGVSGRKIYLCNGNLQMNGGANTVSFVSGTGSVCATGITAIPGFDGATSAANGYSFAANSGMVWGGGVVPFARTTNNADNLCILVGSATRVVGGLSYAIY